MQTALLPLGSSLLSYLLHRLSWHAMCLILTILRFNHQRQCVALDYLEIHYPSKFKKHYQLCN